MATLHVKVVPGSRSNRVVGRYADGIKIQVSAPPEDGKANRAVLQVLSAALGVRVAQLQVLRGRSQPRKVIEISGVDGDVIQKWIEGLSD